jgi:branched-chain amino acid aminotransferase
MRTVWLNGNAERPETAVISVYDRGFLYGDSVFETLRTYGGRPFALRAHMARLARSAERVVLSLPIPQDAMAAEVEKAAAMAGNDESYLRVMLTRGKGPLNLDPDTAERPNRIIFVEPLVVPPAETYERGIGVVLFRTARAADGTAAAGAKVANYLTSLLALHDARLRGASEALVVDGLGRVLEGTTSNVFVVSAGKLVTPPEESGILAGITRAYLLAIAPLAGIAVEIGDIAEPALFQADEIFICSSIREVVPVVRVEGRPVGDGTPGPVTRTLLEAFRRLAYGGIKE